MGSVIPSRIVGLRRTRPDFAERIEMTQSGVAPVGRELELLVAWKLVRGRVGVCGHHPEIP